MSRLHFIRTKAQFDHAHAMWEEPPDDDGLTACPMCDSNGERMFLDEDGKPYRDVCEVCEGHRFLDEDGFPYDPEALQRLCEGD